MFGTSIATGMGSSTCPEWHVNISAEYDFVPEVRTWLHVSADDNGLGLNATEQLDFNQWLANSAHERGLSVGLKNDLDQLEDLVDYFDWHLDEECHSYDECDRLAVFTDAGKAAFVAEYVDDWDDAEDKATEVCGTHEGLSTLIKTWDLGPEFLACD